MVDGRCLMVDEEAKQTRSSMNHSPLTLNHRSAYMFGFFTPRRSIWRSLRRESSWICLMRARVRLSIAPVSSRVRPSTNRRRMISLARGGSRSTAVQISDRCAASEASSASMSSTRSYRLESLSSNIGIQGHGRARAWWSHCRTYGRTLATRSSVMPVRLGQQGVVGLGFAAVLRPGVEDFLEGQHFPRGPHADAAGADVVAEVVAQAVLDGFLGIDIERRAAREIEFADGVGERLRALLQEIGQPDLPDPEVGLDAADDEPAVGDEELLLGGLDLGDKPPGAGPRPAAIGWRH